jgi:hypothetical protein
MRPILLFLILLAPAWAQSWDSLRGLRQGEAVRLTEINGPEHKGTFSAATADTVTIQSDGTPHTFEKAKVQMVKVRSSARRLRNLLIGAGIGVGAGIAVDQSLGTLLRNESGDSKRPLMYLGPIALFGGIGAAIPAYRTVYRVR